MSLSSGTTYLLASLTVTTATGASPVVGDTFTISLVPTLGTGSMSANPNTYFDNFDFNSVAEVSFTAFTSTPGTVTIVASAVPEPVSIISGLTALLILAGVHGARRLRPFKARLQGLSDRHERAAG